MKHKIIVLIGLTGGTIVSLWGSLSPVVQALCITMVVDYITGIMGSYVQGVRLSSSIGFKGICRKLYQLMVVYVCRVLETLIGINIAADMVATAFVANEMLSILENAIHMEVPIPDFIVNAVDSMRKKG